MDRYQDRDGDSSVVGYETGADFLRVQFSDGSVYLYTYSSCGGHNCETMKSLATAGDGLNAFINANVRKAYTRRER